MELLLCLLFIVGAALVFNRPLGEDGIIGIVKEFAWRIIGVLIFVGLVGSCIVNPNYMSGY